MVGWVVGEGVDGLSKKKGEKEKKYDMDTNNSVEIARERRSGIVEEDIGG